MATAEYSEETPNITSSSDVVYDNICQPCENDGRILEAEGKCEDCDEYLCKRCFLGHTLPSITRHHVMVNKEQLLQNSQTQAERKDQCTQRCSQHSDEIIKYYCKMHSFLGCSACIILNHQSCNGTVYIPDAAKDILNSPEYNEYKTDQGALQTKQKEIETNIQEIIQNVNNKKNTAVERIRSFRTEINEALDRAEKDVIEQVERIGSEKLTNLKNNESKSATLKSDIQTISAELECLENKKQFCNLFIALMKTKDKLKSTDKQLDETDCRNDKICELRFKPNYDLDEAMHTVGIGKIVDQITEVERVQHCADIDIKLDNDENTCWITKSVLLQDNKLLLTDWENKKIKMITTCQEIHIEQLQMESLPWDMTLTSQNEVAVTLSSIKKIAFVQINQGLLQHRDISVDGKCRGIVYHDNTLIVSFDVPVKVVVMNMEGVLIRTIITNDSGKSLLNEPLYLAMQSVEETVYMYISNAGGGNVLCVRLDGTVVGTYTDRDLKRPTGMAVDSAGMAYVCDWDTHTVHQITKDCKKKKVLLTKSDGLEKPYTISYSEDKDRLYIGMRDSNIIKVFKVM